MKKGIALHAFGGTKWIGGVYYIRNIAYMLSCNSELNSRYNIFIFTQRELKEAFCDMPRNIRICFDNNKKISKFLRIIKYKFLRVKIVFPVERDLRRLGINSVNWIADFQHKHLPDLFSEGEIEKRERRNLDAIASNNALILSSKDCLKDYRTFYSSEKSKVYVVPFVSYISPIIRSLQVDEEQEILNKYNVKGKRYACVMNQFWQHKNHLVVFQALEYLFRDYPDCGVHVLFTGKMEDFRNPEYIKSLKEYAQKPTIAPHIDILGFISRREQITIMKNSQFVIQPSLFEGWGTVVEDAKVLDKTILLSDIPVHREQMNEKCTLFSPHNARELEELIIEEFKKEHNDNIEFGIEDMKNRSKEYSNSFAKLVMDLEREK